MMIVMIVMVMLLKKMMMMMMITTMLVLLNPFSKTKFKCHVFFRERQSYHDEPEFIPASGSTARAEN